MIKFLGRLFRGMSYVVGTTAPPPGGQEERRFVFLWLGVIGVVAGSFVLMFYVISKMRVP
jgi:hypothetical protein